jgi:hypothetical protein
LLIELVASINQKCGRNNDHKKRLSAIRTNLQGNLPMIVKWITAPVVFYILLPFTLAMGGANYEEKIISSSEEIAALWENMLSN